VLARRLHHGRPARPHRPDVGLQVPAEHRAGVRPQHGRHGHDAVDGRLHRANVVLHALVTSANRKHSASKTLDTFTPVVKVSRNAQERRYGVPEIVPLASHGPKTNKIKLERTFEGPQTHSM